MKVEGLVIWKIGEFLQLNQTMKQTSMEFCQRLVGLFGDLFWVYFLLSKLCNTLNFDLILRLQLERTERLIPKVRERERERTQLNVDR